MGHTQEWVMAWAHEVLYKSFFSYEFNWTGATYTFALNS